MQVERIKEIDNPLTIAVSLWVETCFRAVARLADDIWRDESVVIGESSKPRQCHRIRSVSTVKDENGLAVFWPYHKYMR